MKTNKLLTCVAALCASMTVSNAWYTEGRIYCDANGNGQFDWDVDSPVPGVEVLVENIAGTFSASGVSDASGLFFIWLAQGADSYEETLNMATVPPGTVIVIPPGGVYQYTLNDATPAVSHPWLFESCSPPPPPPPDNPGTGTPGFWKNHPEAWPADTIEIGGVVYTKAQAIALMQKPTKGDKTYNMFEQLVSAILNVEIGNDDSCIDDTLIAADDWMAGHPVGSKVPANSAAWTVGGPLHTSLDQYNNGLLCAPHRD